MVKTTVGTHIVMGSSLLSGTFVLNANIFLAGQGPDSEYGLPRHDSPSP